MQPAMGERLRLVRSGHQQGNGRAPAALTEAAALRPA